jgi:hypothetical protein
MRYKIGPNGWGKERDEILAATKAGLCLHQHPKDSKDPACIEPLRAVLFACWKLPLIFEYCHDPYPYQTYSLAEVEKAIVDERNTVEENYRVMTQELTFRHCIESAIEDLI